MDEQQPLGSLFDGRTCDIFEMIIACLDDADQLIQNNKTADQARIRIAHANGLARSALALLHPEASTEHNPDLTRAKDPKFSIKKFMP